MSANGMTRLLRWVESRCAGRRLRSGSRRRAHLLRRLGKLAAPGAPHRMDPETLQRQGATIYRRFKWDQASVPPEARALCRGLALLEDYLSLVARGIGSPSSGSPGKRGPMAPQARGVLAGAVR